MIEVSRVARGVILAVERGRPRGHAQEPALLPQDPHESAADAAAPGVVVGGAGRSGGGGCFATSAAAGGGCGALLLATEEAHVCHLSLSS